jgi:hypothetical protein
MSLPSYEKPELIDLNEPTGFGACTSGSGHPGGCANGNVAGSVCFTGTTGDPVGRYCVSGDALQSP